MQIKEVNSIFEQPWWMEAVAPGQWGSIEIKSGPIIVARLPYYYSKRFGINCVMMPKVTQTLGIWMNCDTPNRVKLLAKKKDITEKVINRFPYYNIDITLDSSNDYILPFRWRGFRYEPTFSYRFNDLTDLDSIFKGIKDSRKTVIRNAAKQLTVRDDMGIDVLIEMQTMTFKRQNRSNPISEEVVKRVDEACIKHNARKLLVAQDEQGNIHGASYFVYDANTCYYLMSGANPKYRNSGAGSLLLWEGIKFASKVSKQFDFEGSNIEDIEKNFRSFGSQFVVNYRVVRYNLFFEILEIIKPRVKRIIGYKI